MQRLYREKRIHFICLNIKLTVNRLKQKNNLPFTKKILAAARQSKSVDNTYIAEGLVFKSKAF